MGSAELAAGGGFLEELVGLVATGFGVGEDGGEGRPGGVGEDPVGVFGDGCAYVVGQGACAEHDRDVDELDKILLTGFTPEFNAGLGGGRGGPFESVDAFVDFAGGYAEIGFTEIVIHAPVPDGSPASSAAVADERCFEGIVTQGLAQLAA